MKKQLLKSALIAAGFIVGVSGIANAGMYPAGWDSGELTVEDFLDTYAGVGNYTTVNYKNFTGLWNYTAIGYEAGNTNRIFEVGSGQFNPTFTTANTFNFGTWETIDFNSDNLRFRDISDGTARSLDIYNSATNDPSFFKLFRLTDDNYMGFKAGTIIVGWNDNGIGQQDKDFDDIIVALTPVPEPATMLLFGTGIAGLAACARRRKTN